MAAEGLTELLVAWSDGDKRAESALITLVYAELHRLARRHMARERSGVLQTTALVHELYLRLADQSVSWQNREQFFALAARMVRRVLIDQARRRTCERRGGDVRVVPLDAIDEPANTHTRDLLALDDALNALRQSDSRKAQVVELRFFGGLSVVETAAALGISEITVMRDWRAAKAWLHQEIRGALG